MKLHPLSPALLAGLILPGALGAAEPVSDSPVVLDPVVVTGDLWSTELARISAGASVLDQASLSGAPRAFASLTDLVPNLTFSGGTSRPRYFQIRGIGENSQYEGETPDSSVRFLVDDFDFTGIGTLASTFDVEQVEVLRGPQAGAFGANAAGGVVRLVTVAPSPVFGGRVEARAGNDGLIEGGVAVGGPVLRDAPKTLMYRVSAQRHVSDGFRRNVFLDRDTNARDEQHARVRLDWNPGEHWSWQFAGLFSEVDNGFDEFALDNNGERTFSDDPGRDEQRTAALSARGTYSGFESAKITTVTAFTDADSRYSYDDDWTSTSYDGVSDLSRDRQVFSQELRVDGETEGFIRRWTAGAQVATVREEGFYTNDNPWEFRELATDYASDSLSLFSQAAHELARGTRLVLGLRAERVEIDGSGLTSKTDKFSASIDGPNAVDASFSDWLLGGKLTLEHDVREALLVFVSAAQGYKAGGVNLDARIDPLTDPLTYGSETLWNFETGARGAFLDGRLTGSLTLFHLVRSDAQVRDAAGFGGSYRFFTDNGEGGRVTGVELETSYALTDSVNAYASGALTTSKLDAFTLSNGNTGGGRRMANTPRYSFASGLRLRPLADGFLGHLEVAGKDTQFDSNNHQEAREAYTTVNASFGYAWGRWTATLWARNLLDAKYDKRVFFFGNEDPDYLPARYVSRADPLSFGVTLAATF